MAKLTITRQDLAESHHASSTNGLELRRNCQAERAVASDSRLFLREIRNLPDEICAMGSIFCRAPEHPLMMSPKTSWGGTGLWQQGVVRTWGDSSRNLGRVGPKQFFQQDFSARSVEAKKRMRVIQTQLTCNETATSQGTRQPVRTSWRFAGLLCLLALLCPTGLFAQSFAYVNNQSGVSNSISSFSVDTGGVATSLGTTSTGGTGATVACAAIDRIRPTWPAISCLFPTAATSRSVCFTSLRPLALSLQSPDHPSRAA